MDNSNQLKSLEDTILRAQNELAQAQAKLEELKKENKSGWKILLEHAVNSIIQSDFPDDRLLFGYYLSLPINSPLVMKHLNECLKFLSTPFPIELLNYKPDSRMVSVY